MTALRVTKDVIVLPHDNDKWVIYNLFAKTCIGGQSSVLQFLGAIHGCDESALYSVQAEAEYLVWDIGCFSHSNGLMHDPTRFIRNISEWPAPRRLSPKTLLQVLKDCWILIDDEDGYRRRFGPMQTVFDRNHFGNFHQQLGQFLLTKKRENPQFFWYTQKFQEGFATIRHNLYQAIQENFLLSYIPSRFSDPGLRVLDLACGTGYYTNMIARAGANVVGVDMNEHSLDIARRDAPPNAVYVAAAVRDEASLDFLTDDSFDVIFVSDAVLFFFVPLFPKDTPSPEGFFRLARRLLKPSCSLIVLEPHYLFWLAPWFGEENHPFTVLTEYMQRQFLVTPPFCHFFQCASRSDFLLRWIEELLPAEQYKSVDKRAYCFAKEFPLWHLFEFVNVKQA